MYRGHCRVRKELLAGRCLLKQLSFVEGEPSQDPGLKLLARCRPSHGVTGVGHEPELNVVGSGFGEKDGMARANHSFAYLLENTTQ